MDPEHFPCDDPWVTEDWEEETEVLEPDEPYEQDWCPTEMREAA